VLKVVLFKLCCTKDRSEKLPESAVVWKATGTRNKETRGTPLSQLRPIPSSLYQIAARRESYSPPTPLLSQKDLQMFDFLGKPCAWQG
jgi:hypothetical protein